MFHVFSPVFVLQLHHRIQPGEMLVLNNHRMLNGRIAVHLNGGARLLNVIISLKREHTTKTLRSNVSTQAQHSYMVIFLCLCNDENKIMTFYYVCFRISQSTLMSSRAVSRCCAPSMTQTTRLRTSSTTTFPSLLPPLLLMD